jgi:7-cyano-7-deazaguanine synthase
MTRPAVLFSSGLDSAVLLLDAAARHGGAQPIYVSTGLAWEAEERAMAERFLAAVPASAGVLPMAVLGVDMRDVYPASHWAVRGEAPRFESPDADVYLEGRNVVLLSKAAVFAARAGSARICLGPLACNPFPDATPAFFAAMARALSLGLGTGIEIDAPFLALRKAEVIRMGVSLGVPFDLTLSCMQPAGGRHCGRCSKCRERRDAFRDAGVDDPAAYVTRPT